MPNYITNIISIDANENPEKLQDYLIKHAQYAEFAPTDSPVKGRLNRPVGDISFESGSPAAPYRAREFTDEESQLFKEIKKIYPGNIAFDVAEQLGIEKPTQNRSIMENSLSAYGCKWLATGEASLKDEYSVKAQNRPGFYDSLAFYLTTANNAPTSWLTNSVEGFSGVDVRMLTFDYDENSATEYLATFEDGECIVSEASTDYVQDSDFDGQGDEDQNEDEDEDLDNDQDPIPSEDQVHESFLTQLMGNSQAEPNAEQIAIMNAIYNDDVDALKAMNVDVNHQPFDEWTLMHYAAQWASLNVSRHLIDSGADLSLATSNGVRPLDALLHANANYDSDPDLSRLPQRSAIFETITQKSPQALDHPMVSGYPLDLILAAAGYEDMLIALQEVKPANSIQHKAYSSYLRCNSESPVITNYLQKLDSIDREGCIESLLFLLEKPATENLNQDDLRQIVLNYPADIRNEISEKTNSEYLKNAIYVFNNAISARSAIDEMFSPKASPQP